MTENGFTRARARLDAAGASVGFVLVALSLTPSLLPRASWGQGPVWGLAFARGTASAC